MQSLGFESKNPTIFNMIADLESEGREIDFEEFLDAITSKLGDKESRVNFILYRLVSTESLICLMMIELDPSTWTTLEELPSNLVKLWMPLNLKKCFKELLLMDDKFQKRTFTTSWPKDQSDNVIKKYYHLKNKYLIMDISLGSSSRVILLKLVTLWFKKLLQNAAAHILNQPFNILLAHTFRLL